MVSHDLARGRSRAAFVLARSLALSMAAASAGHACAAADAPPACAAGGQALVLQHRAQGSALQVDVDAVPLRGRRVWIAMEGHAGGGAPLRVPLAMAFESAPDEPSMAFGQSDTLLAEPGSDGHVALTQWVYYGLHRLSVLATPPAGTDLSGVTLRLRCSEVLVENTLPTQQALLDELVGLYLDKAVHPPADPARLRAMAQSLATGARTAGDVFAAMRLAMQEAGDMHSYIVASSGRAAFYGRLAPTPPRVALRDDGVAIVALSQVAFDHDVAASTAYARDLHAAIARVQARHPHGWIVDLRGDGGGDMWSMLAGLSALVDGPRVGAFVSPEGTEAWLVSDGQSGTSRYPAEASIGPRDPLAIDSPVAVLIGPGTASSGEATAIAFEARPRTRFFGKPTLGLYNGGVQQYTLSDGTMFGIVHVLNADRTGRVREGALVPDTVIADGDDAAGVAAAWLLAQPAASASRRSAQAPAASAAPSTDRGACPRLDPMGRRR